MIGQHTYLNLNSNEKFPYQNNIFRKTDIHVLKVIIQLKILMKLLVPHFKGEIWVTVILLLL